MFKDHSGCLWGGWVSADSEEAGATEVAQRRLVTGPLSREVGSPVGYFGARASSAECQCLMTGHAVSDGYVFCLEVQALLFHETCGE